MLLMEAALPLPARAADVALRIGLQELDIGGRAAIHDVPLPGGPAFTLRSVSRCGGDGSVCATNADCTPDACISTCDAGDGTCELSGPVEPRRCVTTFAPCTLDSDCGSLGRCARSVSPPVPLVVSNTPTCTTMFADVDATGTFEPSSGRTELRVPQRWRVHLGISLDMPCPRCGAPDESPQIGEPFTCEGGPNDGTSCTVEAVTPAFGGMSTDCPPAVNTNVSGGGVVVPLLDVTSETTERTAAIPCFAQGTCTDGGSSCETNADCTRCTGDLSACTTNADCSAGTCAAAPSQPISCGFYCHCGFCDDDPDAPCFGDDDCSDGARCLPGNSQTGQQELPNGCEDLVCGRAFPERCCADGDPRCPTPTPLAGTCADAPHDSCTLDVECASSECVFDYERCFEHVIRRTGVRGPSQENTESRYVGLACVPKTASAAVNFANGLPGPIAIAYTGHLAGDGSCGNGVVEFAEECDDGNIEDGDGCSAACDVEPICADPNHDGRTTQSDALLILQRAVGLDVVCPLWTCDVNDDDAVRTLDALFALRHSVGNPAPLACGGISAVVLRLATPSWLGAIELSVDPRFATGSFAGDGEDVTCESLLSAEALSSFFRAQSGILSVGLVDLGGFTGPKSLARCAFDGAPADLAPDDFLVEVIDAADPDNGPVVPMPTVVVIPD
jgi:cysteine-rich repeat protein